MSSDSHVAAVADTAQQNDAPHWRAAGMGREGSIPMDLQRAIGTAALAGALITGISAQRPSSEQADIAQQEVEFGIAMAQHGLWNEAVFRFERARDLDPSYAEAFNNLGIGYEQLGRVADSRLMYERARQIDPGHSSIKENLRRFLEIDDRRVRRTAAGAQAAPTTATDSRTPAAEPLAP